MTEMADQNVKCEKIAKYLLAALDVFHFERVHYSSYNGKYPRLGLNWMFEVQVRMIAAKMYVSKIKMALLWVIFFCRLKGFVLWANENAVLKMAPSLYSTE